MELEYCYQESSPQLLRTFIFEQGISRKLLAKIKFQGGKILVNNLEVTVRYELQHGDFVKLVIPDEEENEQVQCDDAPINLLYEDEYLLIVNKPPYVPSVPTSMYLEGTMVNRVKNYIMKQNYVDKQVHVVTRLDKDTSGLMIFAKNGYVHALMDQLLQEKKIQKYYIALVHNSLQLQKHGEINYRIRRKSDSIIEREASLTDGKSALTEYWLEKQYKDFSKVKVQLHTGRTHQIRVHFQAINAPLIGDTLYNPYPTQSLLARQALHCECVEFVHPILQKQIKITAPIPEDMLTIIEEEN